MPEKFVFYLVFGHQTQAVTPVSNYCLLQIICLTPLYGLIVCQIAWCLQIAHSQQETSANFLTVELYQVPFAWEDCAFKILPAKASLFLIYMEWPKLVLRADPAEETAACQQTGRVRCCVSCLSGRKSFSLTFIQSFLLFVLASKQ